MESFNIHKERQVREGIAHGLMSDRVMLHASPDFGHPQMQEIRWALEEGWIASSSPFRRPRIAWVSMHLIRPAAAQGLSSSR